MRWLGFAFVRLGVTWSERGVHELPPALAPPHPFPTQMIVSEAALLVSANTAAGATATGDILNNAGKVFYLH